MRLSKVMLEHLRSIWQVYSGKNVRCLRPTLYENVRTHGALVRRGLIREAEDGTVLLTEAGIRVLAEEVVKNATEAQARLQPREERMGGR